MRLFQSRFVWRLVAVMVTLWSSLGFAEPHLVLLEAEQEQVVVETGLRYLEDPTAEARFSEIRARIDEFTLLPDGIPSFGFSDSAYWFVFDVQNLGPLEAWVLEVGYPHLDDVRLYYDAGADEREQRGGDLQTFDSRYRPYRNINFGIEFANNERKTIWVRIQTEGSVQLPLALYSERAFGDHATQDMTGLGIFYGMFLIMILFNALIWVSTRDKGYGAFTLFLFVFGLFQFAISGLLFQYLLPNAMWAANALLVIVGYMALLGVAGYCITYLPLKKLVPRLERALVGFCFAMALGAGASLLLPYRLSAYIGLVFGLAGISMAILAGVLSERAGYRPARIYLIGWGLFLLTVIIFILKTVAVLPSNFFTDSAWQIGTVFLITFLALGLAERFRGIEEDSARTTRETQAVKTELAEELEARLMIFSGIAHRLNNPLNYIQLGAEEVSNFTGQIFKFIDSLFFGYDDNPEAKRMRAHVDELIDGCERSFERMQVGVFRAARVVSEMRGVSGVDGDAWEECSLDELVDQAREQVEADLGLTYCESVGFSNELESLGRSKVSGNPYLMVQALGQVLENAYLFSPEGRAVSVRFGAGRRQLEHLSIEVRSASGGLEADVEKRLFEMGFSTVGRRGTGLNVARKMLRQDGGDLMLLDAGHESGAVVFSLLLKKGGSASKNP